jgi:hypothetical protein
VHPIPPSAAFPFPWSDSFDKYPFGAQPLYLCDMAGVFVVGALV